MDDIKIILILTSILPFAIIICILIYEYLTEFIRKFFIIKKKSLIFYNEEIEPNLFGIFGTRTRYIKRSIKEITQILKKEYSYPFMYIESYYNKKYYPLYKVYNEDDLKVFKEFFYNIPYIIIKSQYNHYNCILDKEYKKAKDIFKDSDWLTMNNKDHKNFSLYYKKLFIGGLYSKYDLKPIVFETNGKFSNNFNNFINSLIKYYDNEGFELSVLRFKDPEMLVRYNRQKKLKQLSIINDIIL